MPSASTHPYASAGYAKALAEGSGATLEVDDWSSFVLVRNVDLEGHSGRSGLRDAMGVYPMTPIREEAELNAGLAQLAGERLVSVVLIPDPLASPSQDRLRAAFDVCRPFKTHYLLERASGPYAPSKHHRAEIRRAQRRCRIERVCLLDHLMNWTKLYDGLVVRHSISGAADFSPAYFTELSREPRMTAFAAYVGDEISAMTIWFEHAGVAYNHLGASSALGYANSANYALYDAAISHFCQAAIFNLGGAAGAHDDPSDGLAVFKRGFANTKLQTMLCGSVLDELRYGALAQGRPPTGYFPSYRG